jgi:transglutaminase-like putative cysteine protease
LNNWNISRQVNHPVRIEFLGFGEEITPNTMNRMGSIINSSIRDYYVRRWAEKIIERTGEDDLSRAEAIYYFLSTHTNYVKDPTGLELLKTPKVSLNLIEMGEIPGLDCDDLTILSMALLKSIGFRVGLRATGYKPDGKYTHVYGMVLIKPYEWVPFDLVKNLGLGNEAPMNKMAQKDMEV